MHFVDISGWVIIIVLYTSWFGRLCKHLRARKCYHWDLISVLLCWSLVFAMSVAADKHLVVNSSQSMFIMSLGSQFCNLMQIPLITSSVLLLVVYAGISTPYWAVTCTSIYLALFIRLKSLSFKVLASWSLHCNVTGYANTKSKRGSFCSLFDLADPANLGECSLAADAKREMKEGLNEGA